MTKYFKVTKNNLIFVYNEDGQKSLVLFYSLKQYNGLVSDGLIEIKEKQC